MLLIPGFRNSMERKMRFMKMMFLIIIISLFTFACGSSGNNNGGEDSTPPNVPTDVASVNTSYSSINVTWTESSDPSGVKEYEIYRATSTDGDLTALVSVEDAMYSDTGLDSYTTYCYSVAAVDTKGNVSAQSSKVCSTTDDSFDTIAPDSPSGVTAADISLTEITIEWSAPADSALIASGIDGYNIYKAEGVGGDMELLTSVTGTTHTDTGLTSFHTYCYTVAAYDKAGNESTQSNKVCTDTDGSFDTLAPDIPENISAVNVSFTAINVAWNVSADNPSEGASGTEGYKVYRALGTEGDLTFIGSITVPMFSDIGLTSDQEYCYTVEAYDVAGNTSAQSTKVCEITDGDFDITPPSVPAGVTATAAASTQVDLSWDASTDDYNVKGYHVYKGAIKIASVTGTSHSDTGLIPDTEYCYTVVAYDDSLNESAASISECATTGPNNPPDATIISPSDGAIFTEGDTISFEGSAFDFEDGPLDDAVLTWTSSNYGQIGTGSPFDRDDFCAGSHKITLTAIDSESLEGSTSVDITIDQVGEKTWSTTFGGSNSDEARSVQQTSDGGYIIAGTTASFGGGDNDMYLIKTDGCGSMVWEKTFGSTDYVIAKSVQQTSDGGYIIAGHIVKSSGDEDAYLVKTDSEGNTDGSKGWELIISDPERHHHARSVQQTSDGGYIITGSTATYVNNVKGDEDVYLAKILSSGAVDWEQNIGGGQKDRAYSVQETSDGGYIIAGYTASFGTGDDEDVYLIKTDSDGERTWSNRFGGTGTDHGASVIQDTDGSYIITGSTTSPELGAVGEDIYLIKALSDGTMQWDTNFGNGDDEYGAEVQLTADNDYIIVGTTRSRGAGEKDVYLIKTTRQGVAYWRKTYGGTDNEQGDSVMTTSDGGYIIAGHTESFGHTGQTGRNVYVIKTDSAGNNPDQSSPTP